uniref:Uncharacterized protein n=1 Tax=Strongyloides venezuelensis TaxID=75913 RepID=A0A0K0FU62_STRVS
MKLSFLIIWISLLCTFQDKKCRKTKKPTPAKKLNNHTFGKKPKPKITCKTTTTLKPERKHKPPYEPPYYTSQDSVKYYLCDKLEPIFSKFIKHQFDTISFCTCLKSEKLTSKGGKIDIDSYSDNFVRLSTTKGNSTKVCLKDGITKNEVLFWLGYLLRLVPEIIRNDITLNVYVIQFLIEKLDYEKYYKLKDNDSKVIANNSFDFYSKMLQSLRT